MKQPPTLEEQVTALAGELDHLRRATEKAQESANRTNKSLILLVERIRQQPASQALRQTNAVPVVSWLRMEEADRAATLGKVIDWLDAVYLQYPDAKLSDCWYLHPAAVEELLALWVAWTESYEDEKASGLRAVTWHDHHRPGVVSRLKHLDRCSLDNHADGQPEPVSPAPRPPAVLFVAA